MFDLIADRYTYFNLLKTLGVLLGILVARALVGVASTRIKAVIYGHRTQTIRSVIVNSVNFTVVVAALYAIFTIWGIDTTPILTGAGILGIAVGFGSQNLVRDVVSGLFILLDGYVNIGDRIKVANLEGEVLKVNLRNVIIKSEDGSIHIIPNSAISIITKFPTSNN